MDIVDEHRLRTRTTAVVLDWAAEREPPFRGEDKAGYGEAIVAAHIVADEARLTLHRWIDAARRADMSWSEIGEVLGISKQAAQQRFRALTTTDTSMAEAEVVRTGATAFNEMRILADEGRQGHELTGVGVLTLTFRTSDRQWEYCRRVGSGSGSDTARLKDAGWEHVASYLPFHYYKRAMG